MSITLSNPETPSSSNSIHHRLPTSSKSYHNVSLPAPMPLQTLPSPCLPHGSPGAFTPHSRHIGLPKPLRFNPCSGVSSTYTLVMCSCGQTRSCECLRFSFSRITQALGTTFKSQAWWYILVIPGDEDIGSGVQGQPCLQSLRLPGMHETLKVQPNCPCLPL